MEGKQGEAIMICIDTSRWMLGNNAPMYKQQADAIKLYCTKKLESHEDTVVGVCGTGANCTHNIADPSRNLSRIMNSLNKAGMGGDSMFVKGVIRAHTVWFGCRGEELGNHLPKRIVVFTGGPVYEEMREVQLLGKGMKDKNVACDVIMFGDLAIKKQQLFTTLIDTANNNGNCNLLRVPPNSTVHDALLSSQIIQCGSAPFASPPVQQESSKQNIMSAGASYSVADARSLSRSHVGGRLRPLGNSKTSKQNIMSAGASYSVADARSLSRSHVGGRLRPLGNSKTSKQNIMAAANYPESLDPCDHPAKVNALSQSVVDPKLENRNPCSQPETLDQTIERMQRELDSLIMLKNKLENKQVAC